MTNNILSRSSSNENEQWWRLADWPADPPQNLNFSFEGGPVLCNSWTQRHLNFQETYQCACSRHHRIFAVGEHARVVVGTAEQVHQFQDAPGCRENPTSGWVLQVFELHKRFM